MLNLELWYIIFLATVLLLNLIMILVHSVNEDTKDNGGLLNRSLKNTTEVLYPNSLSVLMSRMFHNIIHKKWSHPCPA